MILEYKLEETERGMKAPSWIKDGGYFISDDGTLIGYTPNDAEYNIPSYIKVLTLDKLISREIQKQYLKGDGTTMTTVEITDMVTNWYNSKESGSIPSFIAKLEVNQTIDSLTVTTSAGNEFDANLEARQNMADAILASETLGQTSTTWRLADNTQIVISLAELKEASALAIQRYAEVKGIQ